jgi:hypothetical protein
MNQALYAHMNNKRKMKKKKKTNNGKPERILRQRLENLLKHLFIHHYDLRKSSGFVCKY